MADWKKNFGVCLYRQQWCQRNSPKAGCWSPQAFELPNFVAPRIDSQRSDSALQCQWTHKPCRFGHQAFERIEAEISHGCFGPFQYIHWST